MNLQEYVKPELLVLVPVLYVIANGIKKTSIKCNNIPWILGVTGVLLALAYLLSVETITNGQQLSAVIFGAITQGVLVAGAAVYTNQLIKQAQKEG